MIAFDLSDKQFNISLAILKTKDLLKYNQLLLSLHDATGIDVKKFFEDYKVAPLDMPHFFEPIMFASFVVVDGYFKIFGHFETNNGFATGRIKLVAFWEPSYLLPR